MKLHRDLGVTQKTAWFMQQRIREAFREEGPMVFAGPVEVDETYFGGWEKNKHSSKKLRAGRGTVGKTAVVGAKDRATNQVAARVVEGTEKKTLQGFVKTHVAQGAKVYTDNASAYDGLENREAVKHSVAEYVRGQAHTNGVESFWSMLKRAHKGTFHKLEREAPTALRERVRGPSQHPRDGHDQANGTRRGCHGRASAHVPGPDRLGRKSSEGLAGSSGVAPVYPPPNPTGGGLMANTLYFGDCLNVMREHIPDESIDLIYLDPPFKESGCISPAFASRAGGLLLHPIRERAGQPLVRVRVRDRDERVAEPFGGRSGDRSDHSRGQPQRIGPQRVEESLCGRGRGERHDIEEPLLKPPAKEGQLRAGVGRSLSVGHDSIQRRSQGSQPFRQDVPSVGSVR